MCGTRLDCLYVFFPAANCLVSKRNVFLEAVICTKPKPWKLKSWMLRSDCNWRKQITYLMVSLMLLRVKADVMEERIVAGLRLVNWSTQSCSTSLTLSSSFCDIPWDFFLSRLRLAAANSPSWGWMLLQNVPQGRTLMLCYTSICFQVTHHNKKVK